MGWGMIEHVLKCFADSEPKPCTDRERVFIKRRWAPTAAETARHKNTVEEAAADRVARAPRLGIKEQGPHPAHVHAAANL